MHVTIFGKAYRWLFLPPSKMPKSKKFKIEGECHPPDAPGKTIKIDNSLSDSESLRVVIHEYGHASDWHKSEEWIDEHSTGLARLLIKLGWHR